MIGNELISSTEYIENGIPILIEEYKGITVKFTGKPDASRVARFIIEQCLKDKSLYK